MIVLIYATTSGSTELFVKETSRQIGKDTLLVNINSKNQIEQIGQVRANLVIAGGPTYGMGDWHHSWGSMHQLVMPALQNAKNVALFGLGDSRFHGKTFCGGLGKLYDFVAASGVNPVGSTPADGYSYASTPALRNGVFPGFVVDYKQDRRNIGPRISAWLGSLL